MTNSSSPTLPTNTTLTIDDENIQLVSFPTGNLGCNTSFIWDKISKRALIVDPGNDEEIVLKFCQSHQLKVLGLIHTHAHFDHIGFSKELGQAFNAPVWLHPGDDGLYKMLQQQGGFFGARVGNYDENYLKLEDEQSFTITSAEQTSTSSSAPSPFQPITTLFTPGHTPGSCCFYWEQITPKNKAPILFAGDTLFKNSVGRTDLPGGDFQKIQKSIKERLYKLPGETICIPGHGPITTIKMEAEFNPFVKK